ncbi:MAG: 2-oxoacid:acceptor oxidoreductase subunit alpha [Gammaproteobacteria bacterium]|nr:2-oxoacid:acceptor oxidoreductase subunit alpha [Gammaproteobacteria bacterium]
MSESYFSVAITGSGGTGAVTTGLIFLEAMAHQGYYGFMIRSAGPQIRGGESAVMLNFSSYELHSTNDHFDYLLAFDWFNIERFIDEIPLNNHSQVIYDAKAGEVPKALQHTQANFTAIDLQKEAKVVTDGRANMIGLGILCQTFEISEASITHAVNKVLGKKGEKVTKAAIDGITAGMNNSNLEKYPIAKLSVPSVKRWSISGNEACGLGALTAGVKFVAAYPITPATEVLEWMSPRLEKLGGNLLQAEDELASINMIIGASFGGVPSLTATSGPGLSLMMEGLGLAVTSETPLVVINVMRGGPSTGIPTKSEQSDLNIALYGFHGDAPHLVLAPLNIADSVFTTQWACYLAEQLQTVAIVLSDQSLGQSRAVINEPLIHTQLESKRLIAANEDNYLRYQLTESGVSPMSIPGMENTMYTADGLEHNPQGTPSSMSHDHLTQMNKRQNKIEKFNYQIDGEDYWSNIETGNYDIKDTNICLITWGSASAMVEVAAQRLRSRGKAVKTIAIRLIMPLQKEALIKAIGDSHLVMVIEQNQGKQLFQYLHANQALPGNTLSYARPGPLPLRPGEIMTQVGENL